MIELTERQREILAFIEHEQARTGVAPSTREIQVHFGFASQTAAINHLRALEKKGIILRHAGKARALALVTTLRRETIIDIPLYGEIAAGFAQTLDPVDEGLISVDGTTVGIRKGENVFALKVRGESMIDAGIHSGDLAILEIREPRHDDVVAALIDGETTLKRFISQEGRTYLRAENPSFPDLIPAEELLVQGVMVALIRKFRR